MLGYANRFLIVSLPVSFGLAVLLLLNPMTSRGSVETPQALDANPHGDSERCEACHVLEDGTPGALLYEDDVMALCKSCHDGGKNLCAVHPVDVPADSVGDRMPDDFPLREGRMTCVTCHAMTRSCEDDPLQAFYLRGNADSTRVAFCGHCHGTEETRPLNVHDQVGPDGLKIDRCQWCHVGPWKAESPAYENPEYPVRSSGAALCENCHRVADDHPSGGRHVDVRVPEDMKAYMAANEMRSTMRLPFKELLKFVKAAKRQPRTMPLIKTSRMTCYTCHNPHETGVIKPSNPRALGAETKQAKNRRLRTAKAGQMCQACHNK